MSQVEKRDAGKLIATSKSSDRAQAQQQEQSAPRSSPGAARPTSGCGGAPRSGFSLIDASATNTARAELDSIKSSELLSLKTVLDEPNNNSIHLLLPGLRMDSATLSSSSSMTMMTTTTTTSSQRRRPLAANSNNQRIAGELSSATTATPISVATIGADRADSNSTGPNQQQPARMGSINQTTTSTGNVPSYSSIFKQAALNDSYRRRRSLTPPGQQPTPAPATTTTGTNQIVGQQQTVKTIRGPLRKQPAEVSESIVKRSLDRKLNALNFNQPYERDRNSGEKYDENGCDDYGDDDSQEDEEEEEEELDIEAGERLAFSVANSTASRLRQDGKRSSPEAAANKYSGSATRRHHHHHHSNGRQAESNNNLYHKKPSGAHTKISFNEMSHPPSFNTFQQSERNNNNTNNSSSCRKLELLEQAAYLSCHCNNCSKKRKLAALNGGAVAYHIGADFFPEAKKYPKTRAMHLVLKSIILLLCTLLLLLVLVGAIVASHYLPLAFDRMLNVSRSFNVTIAGR